MKNQIAAFFAAACVALSQGAAGAAFSGGAAENSDALLMGEIFAPKAVAVQPTFASRDLCRLEDGEIRHYGWMNIGGKKRRVYIASRDGGLSWKRFVAKRDDATGPMVKSPWSGEWLYFTRWNEDAKGRAFLVRSKTGPDGADLSYREMPLKGMELRQIVPLKSRKRWIATFNDALPKPGDCSHSIVAYSDDDGREWKRVDLKPIEGVPRILPGGKRPHWFNNGCEPTVAELADGTLLMALRTSGPTHWTCVSRDGGETWGDYRPMEGFYAVNTMPYFFRLKDGRLLFIWNNTSILPTCDPKEIPEASRAELAGDWETYFTNRDALHAAISEDDGKTWKGFRELVLSDCRGAPDFKQLGWTEGQEGDKSVHQTQALELEDGKVLLALGQNSAARRIVIFDPDWLCEKERFDDFRNGLGGVSTHLYVKSLSSGGWEGKGWSGHCAMNRLPGAVIMREPEEGRERKWRRESLFIGRIRDERLVGDRQGVAWNFPAGKAGEAAVSFRNEGEGFRFTLADRWINPCDLTTAKMAPFTRVVGPAEAGKGKWRKLKAAWDGTGKVELTLDGKVLFGGKMAYVPAHGLSYLHIQTAAEGEDRAGVYFRSFRAKSLD